MAILIFMNILTFMLSWVKHEKSFITSGHAFLWRSSIKTRSRMREYPILCCDVSCYYSKKNFLRDSDRSYTPACSDTRDLCFRAKTKTIISYISIWKLPCFTAVKNWIIGLGVLTLCFKYFKNLAFPTFFKFVINDYDRYSNKATNQSHKL